MFPLNLRFSKFLLEEACSGKPDLLEIRCNQTLERLGKQCGCTVVNIFKTFSEIIAQQLSIKWPAAFECLEIPWAASLILRMPPLKSKHSLWSSWQIRVQRPIRLWKQQWASLLGIKSIESTPSTISATAIHTRNCLVRRCRGGTQSISEYFKMNNI